MKISLTLMNSIKRNSHSPYCQPLTPGIVPNSKYKVSSQLLKLILLLTRPLEINKLQIITKIITRKKGGKKQ